MKKIKNIMMLFFFALVVFVTSSTVKAQEKINVYEFYGNGCPHCEDMATWYEDLSSSEKSKFNLVKFEVWYDSANSTLLNTVATKLGYSKVGVPFIIVGDQVVQGFAEDFSTGDQILALVDEQLKIKASSRYDISKQVDLSKGNAEGTLTASETNDLVIIIALVVIVVLIVGLLIFARVATGATEEEIKEEIPEKKVVEVKNTSEETKKEVPAKKTNATSKKSSKTSKNSSSKKSNKSKKGTK